MGKLTIDETIQHAHQLWTHIAKTGDTKSQAKEYLVCTEDQQHLKYLGFVNSYCSFCAYDVQFTGYGSCKRCPARGMWVEGNPEATCEYKDAPYNAKVMRVGSPYAKRKVATAMLELIEKAATDYNVNL